MGNGQCVSRGAVTFITASLPHFLTASLQLNGMKIIQMGQPGGPEVLEVADKPLPEPAAGEVRVRAQAIGISSADMLVRKGTYNWMPPLPATPGNEMAGVVDALGSGAVGVRV